MSSNSGCRDRNECDYGSYAENTHNCVRSSNNGICMNNAGASSPYSSSHHQLMKNQSYETIKNGSDIRPGSFSCGSCSTSGTRRYGSSGTVKRSCLSFVQIMLLFSFHQIQLFTATATRGGTARTRTSNGTSKFRQTTIHR